MSEKRLTQTAVAKLLGVSQSSIHRVLAGDGKRAGPARRQVAEALNRIHIGKYEYSSSASQQNLVAKVMRMCEREGDEAVLDALLDAVTAFRGRNAQ